MSPEMQRRTRGMLVYKRDLSKKLPEEKARQRLMQFMKIDDPAVLEHQLANYVENSQIYLQAAAEEVQLLEKRTLQPLTDDASRFAHVPDLGHAH